MTEKMTEYVAIEEYGTKMTDAKISVDIEVERFAAFLKIEIEGEERIRLAKTDFAPKVRYDERKEKISRSSYATTTVLFSGGVEREKTIAMCIFCEKRHESKECYHAKKIDFEKKQEILKSKRCCFSCLKSGHQSKVCKSNVQCLFCNKRHWALMCPELSPNKTKVKTPGLEEKLNVSLSNHCAVEVLQTLQVDIKAEGKPRRVRALTDRISQRPYSL
ncbi:transposon Tf2-6 polyprotein [Trichonephila clavata]|uniref:Transposon Tf2-6 polyprotein n=1 Tax=Trichonephila clavata TaxID=2740835 RepID=A0A8X6IA24_TRICU|nr:transposon Tf2-6 polyprotein [Trichonephila clavata]